MACFFACLLALESWGQSTTKPPATYKSEPEDFRIVNGRLYNAITSTNFIYLPQYSGPSGYFEVEKITPQGVVFRPTVKSYAPDYIQRFLVKHLPNEKELFTGQTFANGFRAMRITPVTIGKETFATYDYGLPNTPENRKTLTNSMAAPKP